MKQIIRTSILSLLLAVAAACPGQEPIGIPDGYATLNGGTTGGGDSTPLLVTTAGEFRSAVSNDDPAVIVVQGRLDVGNVTIGSNKTIVGADTASGLYGGHIKVDGSNYIFQNLIIGPSTEDAMELTGATNVFIYKCEFYDGADGNLDIVRGSDYVTVAWCKFYYVDRTEHKFSILLGNSDDMTTDRGKLHVTLHHNWFAEKCTSRMPRVRYGHVHIYNNYYNSIGNNYCIGIGVECHIRAENSHFDSVNKPWADYGGTENGEIGWDGMKFENSALPTFMPNAYPVFSIPYDYDMDEVDAVRDLLTNPEYGAGNRKPGKEPATTPVIEISDPSITLNVGIGEEIPDAIFQVWNAGIDILNYRIEVDASWLAVSPASGSSGGESEKVNHTISFDNASLPAGTHIAQVTVMDDGSGAPQANVTLEVAVKVGPLIGTTTFGLDAAASEGNNPAAGGLYIYNKGKDTLLYELTDDAGWMSISPTSGTSAGIDQQTLHSVIYDTAELPAGHYTGSIIITSSVAGLDPEVIPVSVVVNPIPIISVYQESLHLSMVKGTNPETLTFTVWNSGTGDLDYAVSENISWLTVQPESGSSSGIADQVIHSVYINPRGLAVGNYSGTINLVADDASNSPRSISLSLSIQDPNASPWNPDVNGDMDTASFLGWINVSKAPWIWNYPLQTWIYAREDSITDSGGWFYFPDHFAN